MTDPNNPNSEWQQVPPASPADPAAYPPPPSSYPPPNAYPPPAASSGLSDNAAAAISYITFIPAIIFLVMEPYNRKPFVKFHAIQCLLFNAVMIVVFFVLGILLTMMMHMLSVFGLFGLILWPLLDLCAIVIWGITVYKASQGQWFKLPIIGDIALQQAQK